MIVGRRTGEDRLVVGPDDFLSSAQEKMRSGDFYRLPALRDGQLIGIAAVKALLDAGVAPITPGGGVPVVRGSDGDFSGVEAVIDKDFSSSLLAVEIGAETLIVLTDVDRVNLDFAGARKRPIKRMTSARRRPERPHRPA